MFEVKNLVCSDYGRLISNDGRVYEIAFGEYLKYLSFGSGNNGSSALESKEQSVLEVKEIIEQSIPEIGETIEQSIPEIGETIEQSIPEIGETIEQSIPEIGETIPEVKEIVERLLYISDLIHRSSEKLSVHEKEIKCKTKTVDAILKSTFFRITIGEKISNTLRVIFEDKENITLNLLNSDDNMRMFNITMDQIVRTIVDLSITLLHDLEIPPDRLSTDERTKYSTDRYRNKINNDRLRNVWTIVTPGHIDIEKRVKCRAGSYQNAIRSNGFTYLTKPK
jgi:hypothetical protein